MGTIICTRRAYSDFGKSHSGRSASPMSFSVAALRATGDIYIKDCANVATSFPGFVELAQSVGMKVQLEESA